MNRTRGIPLHALHCSATQIAPLLQLRIRRAAKSIAACGVHVQKKLLKNLHGGLRCDTLGCDATHARQPASQQRPPRLARIGSTAKSIAACKMHPPKNLHGGLRCAKRGTLCTPTPLLRYCTATPQKKTNCKETHIKKPLLKSGF